MSEKTKDTLFKKLLENTGWTKKNDYALTYVSNYCTGEVEYLGDSLKVSFSLGLRKEECWGDISESTQKIRDSFFRYIHKRMSDEYVPKAFPDATGNNGGIEDFRFQTPLESFNVFSALRYLQLKCDKIVITALERNELCENILERFDTVVKGTVQKEIFGE